MQTSEQTAFHKQSNAQKQQSANQVLKRVFGFDSFRASQSAIINNVLKAENTLAIMPTGGGKSLCYQIPAVLFDGLSVVISPLISLMQDQVRQLDELNVPSCFLNSTLSPNEYQENIARITSGKIKLLFLAPETALQVSILNMLDQCKVACIAIDEAHCISEWGHEFRPEYRQLNVLIERLDDAVCLALTATATPRVREDIKRQLNIADDSEFISSFDRPNLYIEVSEKDSPYRQTTAFIDKHPNQSGIIYCQSRAGVNELTQKLTADGYSALAYHAGLNHQKRSEYQDKFVRDDVNIIVATIAFGMGINKPDVRYVLHYDLPKNIESYYQQIGRAGRDGIDANCLLLFGYGDIGKNRFFIDQMHNEQEKRLATMHLNQMLALAETEDCRRIGLLQYFGEQDVQGKCHKCDNCLSEAQQQTDLSVPAQKFLSCTYRTGQIFGAGHIVDVLRGSSAEKILQNQHNLLSTYGIGKEYTKKQWMALSRQLIQKGFLRQDEQFGSLKFTPSTQDILRGHKPFLGRLQEAKAESAPRANSATLLGEIGLLELLRSERKRLADNAKVPPYAIFSDRSLQEMAFYFPHSVESFLKIHGVGQSKAQKYADIFLGIIEQYCESKGLTEQGNENAATLIKNAATSNKDLSAKTQDIVNAFEAGQSVAELATQHKVKLNTVYGHLYKYVQHGKAFSNSERLLTEINLDNAQLQLALDAFREHGHERLKPVFDVLGERVNYDQLHLLRVYFLHSTITT
ncbi:DNA helicase RecQ [Glaciecola sp. SC05]|uniref:DNA helicase RecQ n=1 Tax=Glaciecola sp. SC05 TaxID=1987355 RepID=UPI00352888B6